MLEQIKKNTVEAKNQLVPSDYISFDGLDHTGVRVMFVGNSITLHGIKEDIGWHQAWGMAASAKEKDYVHLCFNRIRESYPDAAFCICQAAQWEMKYKDGKSTYPLFESARNFEADIIVMRLVENCPFLEYDKEEFVRCFGDFIEYLNKDGHAKVIVTNGFWKHPADEAIQAYAKRNQLPFVDLGDLGEREDMKAIGLFAHEGVANHPGDLGMEHIAKRICDVLLNQTMAER